MLQERLQGIFPKTRVDDRELDLFLRRIKSSAANFYLENGDNLLVAYTDDLPFSSKKQSVLAVWIGSGEGMSMFREWMRWVRSRKAIRLACYTPLHDDERLERVLIRFGFKRRGGMFVWER